jgi:transposase
MDQFTKKKYFIGIDISNEHLDVALLKAEALDVFKDKTVDNSFTGFDAIKNWLLKQRVKLDDCLFCMEHTGTYGLLLFAWLSKLGIDYCVEPGMKIKRSLGIARGKNDQVDARRIADYAATNRAKLKPFQMPSSLLLQIKQFLTYRDQQTKIKVSLKNSLKSHDQYQRVSGVQGISDEIQQQIEEYDQRIDRIDVQIIDLIRTDENLKKNFDLATSVKGIGLVIAAFMLVTTNNFASFENGRKYACYTGIAPFENSSGKYRGKTRVSHLANKRVKVLLSSGANSARKWDPELHAYYARKIEEGKEHKLVINSIRCKMVNRVFAVIKRGTPYVTTYQQKIA